MGGAGPGIPAPCPAGALPPPHLYSFPECHGALGPTGQPGLAGTEGSVCCGNNRSRGRVRLHAPGRGVGDTERHGSCPRTRAGTDRATASQRARVCVHMRVCVHALTCARSIQCACACVLAMCVFTVCIAFARCMCTCMFVVCAHVLAMYTCLHCVWLLCGHMCMCVLMCLHHTRVAVCMCVHVHFLCAHTCAGCRTQLS